MVHPWWGEHVPSPFVSPRAKGQGSWAAARTMCSPQGRQVSCGFGHSTQRHTHTCRERGARPLEDGDIIVNLGAVALGDALGDPHNVATLLLLELHKGVEDTEVELVQEGQLVQFHLWTEAGMVCSWL